MKRYSRLLFARTIFVLTLFHVDVKERVPRHVCGLFETQFRFKDALHVLIRTRFLLHVCRLQTTDALFTTNLQVTTTGALSYCSEFASTSLRTALIKSCDPECRCFSLMPLLYTLLSCWKHRSFCGGQSVIVCNFCI